MRLVLSKETIRSLQIKIIRRVVGGNIEILQDYQLVSGGYGGVTVKPNEMQQASSGEGSIVVSKFLPKQIL